MPLKVTGRALIHDVGNVIDSMNAITATGVTVAIDDFGTRHAVVVQHGRSGWLTRHNLGAQVAPVMYYTLVELEAQA